jgi:hypothetical protein
MKKSHQTSMLLLGAVPQGLFLHVFSWIAANQHKCLSMSTLHKNTAFSIKPQSSPIKVNRVIFLIITPRTFSAMHQLISSMRNLHIANFPSGNSSRRRRRRKPLSAPTGPGGAGGTARNPSKPPLGTFTNVGKSRLRKAAEGKKK